MTKAKPTKLKELAGTARKDRISEQEPTFDVPIKFPDAPEFMTEGAKEIWSDLGTRLLCAGLFTSVDMQSFSMFCVAADRWVEAERKITDMGMMIETLCDNGVTTYRVNPYMATANKSWDQMKKMLSEFGLTPAERTRMVAAKPGVNKSSLADKLFDMAQSVDNAD